jgi:hypothetical protein
MDKRYQVFVSSTYEDLKEERRMVMQVLLEMNCIPAGMELFSAEDEDQWTVIRKVIDDCDYYVVIVGGRYGSMTSDGKSYTQKEYEYAVSQKKPVMAFLPEDPDKIPSGNTDDDPQMKQKLGEFKNLLKNKMCKFWNNPDHLAGAVSRSINNMINNRPAIGWIKGDISADVNAEEILRLRKQIDFLNTELGKLRISGPPGSEELAQGDDRVRVRFSYYVRQSGSGSVKKQDYVSLTWDKIFSRIAPLMMIDAEENPISSFVDELIEESSLKRLIKKHGNKDISSFSIEYEDLTTVMIQFKSLGLIKKSPIEHPNDSRFYWTLTEYGENTLAKIRAVKRKTTDQNS